MRVDTLDAAAALEVVPNTTAAVSKSGEVRTGQTATPDHPVVRTVITLVGIDSEVAVEAEVESRVEPEAIGLTVVAL